MNLSSSYRILLNSLKLTFHHIRHYSLDYKWQIHSVLIKHAVLWYVETGEIRITVDGSSYKAKEGQLILLPSNSRLTTKAVSSKVNIVSINFDVELELLNGRDWAKIFKLPVMYPSYDMMLIEPVITSMLKESREPSFAQSMLLQSSLQRLIAMMFNQYYRFHYAGEDRPIFDPRVQAVIEYVSLHPSHNPTLAELCHLVHVSDSYLRKLFIDNTGMSPLSFIHQIKIEHAQKLLVSETDRVIEIAHCLGFKDANYFSRLFKKKTGYTPFNYRKKLRNWISD